MGGRKSDLPAFNYAIGVPRVEGRRPMEQLEEDSEWGAVPDDPHPEDHLGYEMEELTVIESATDSKYIFLPADESQLGEEEFIVVGEKTLTKLEQ